MPWGTLVCTRLCAHVHTHVDAHIRTPFHSHTPFIGGLVFQACRDCEVVEHALTNQHVVSSSLSAEITEMCAGSDLCADCTDAHRLGAA